MGFIGKILGKPQKETGNEQYERVTGAKTSADAAYEKATDAKQTGKSATQAGNTIHKWGDRISASASNVSSKVKSPAFQNFAKNAVHTGNNIFGGNSTGFGGNDDIVGLGNAPRIGSKKKGKNKMRPAFYDPETGKTYVARTSKKVVAKKKSKKDVGPQEFDPW